MRPFIYERAASSDLAIKSLQSSAVISEPVAAARAHYLAGGTTLLDLMKLDVMHPEHVIDINGLAGQFSAIQSNPDALHIGGMVRMAEAIAHPVLRREVPVLVQSLELAASQQLRNMATLGGNVLQRTRCPYFRDITWQACNKRDPGSGCTALEGFNRMHAVLGVSAECIATYPGDFAQALLVLDAAVEIAGVRGQRIIDFEQLHVPPGETPHIETTLLPGELIVGFSIPRAAWQRRSLYLKVRDRESYEFALASTAVALDLRDARVHSVRIALGGVATVPWRAKSAETFLQGKPLDEANARLAADAAFQGARALEHNAYKIQLGKQTLTRALLTAASLEVPDERSSAGA